jgi:hypothetical protein
MEVAPASLLDRITILRLKVERYPDEYRLAEVREELESCEASFQESVPSVTGLEELERELGRINATLWDLEDRVRQLEAAGDFGEEFVHAARTIFRTNDERFRVKDAINRLVGSHFVELKVHAPDSPSASSRD